MAIPARIADWGEAALYDSYSGDLWLQAESLMIAEVAVPTLIEDWRIRRSQLEAVRHESGERAAALAKLLDYLIGRYEGTEAANQPARAAPPPATLVNTRAMVVHHHLWFGVVAGVKSPKQAQERMARVLHRMEESFQRQHEGGFRDDLEADDAMGEVQGLCMPRSPNREALLRLAISLGVGERWAICHCLEVSPYLPRNAVAHLAARASLGCVHDPQSVRLLARCGSRHVFEWAAAALANRVEKVGYDDISEALAELLRNPRVQAKYYPKSVKAAQSRLRERLAAEDAAERMRAIRLLALVGDLQDIALLADLAALLDGSADCRGEHGALISAMEVISRRPVVS